MRKWYDCFQSDFYQYYYYRHHYHGIFFKVKKHCFFIKKSLHCTFLFFESTFLTKMFSAHILRFCFVDDLETKPLFQPKLIFWLKLLYPKGFFIMFCWGEKNQHALLNIIVFKMDMVFFPHRYCPLHSWKVAAWRGRKFFSECKVSQLFHLGQQRYHSLRTEERSVCLHDTGVNLVPVVLNRFWTSHNSAWRYPL